MGGGGAGAVLGQRVFGKGAVATKGAVPPARDAVHRDRGIKVIRNPFALLFRCRVQQPHQHEEGHHGRDKVSIGDFPGTPMMPTTLHDLLPLDDDWRGIPLPGHSLTHVFTPGIRSSGSRLRPG